MGKGRVSPKEVIVSEHRCRECKTGKGDTCTLTGATHTTGIECPSFKQKESKMFKIGDRVRVVANEVRLTELQIPKAYKLTGVEGKISYAGERSLSVDFDNSCGGNWSLHPRDLELVDCPKSTLAAEDDHNGLQSLNEPQPSIRTFDTGATRDTDQGKLDYLKALSPIVLRRYVEYLNKHRKQPDGSYRDFDNWKKGIPEEAYISGNGRHFMDTWLLTEGYDTEDNHGPVEIEDAICAQLFNLMGRLHEMLKEKI